MPCQLADRAFGARRSGGRADGWSDGRTVGRSDGRTVGRSGGRTVGRSDGRPDRWTVGRTDERTDGWSDGRADGRSDGRTVGRTAGEGGLKRLGPMVRQTPVSGIVSNPTLGKAEIKTIGEDVSNCY